MNLIKEREADFTILLNKNKVLLCRPLKQEQFSDFKYILNTI